MPSPSPATDTGDPRDRAVAVFMDSLARSPLPRPRPLDPSALVRRAPLVASLRSLQARERRLLVPAALLEILTFAAAAVVGLQLVLPGTPLAHLGAVLDARLVWAPVGLSLFAAALPLLWLLAEATRPRRLRR